jgi:hypothetical protein
VPADHQQGTGGPINVRDVSRTASHSKFIDWQADYASKNIATFPVSEQKIPLVRYYGRIGLNASEQIAHQARFADAPAIAFMAGPRNRVTVLDIDEPGDKALQQALDRHGTSPIIVRTASGKHHVWFKHNGERRSVRPEPSIAVDVLGNRSIVIAPPSRGVHGSYLRAHNGPRSTFMIANSLEDELRMPRKRLAKARHRLLDCYVRLVRKPSDGRAAFYQWREGAEARRGRCK